MPAVANAPTTRDDYLAMVAGAIVDASKRLPRPRRATGAREPSPSLTSPAPSVEPRSWRVYAVSDLHADMPANMRWLEALPSFPPRSALIVAGDVATANAVTRQALLLLKARFEEVIWCPGNHELWLPAAPNDATLRGYPDDSLGKLMSLIDLCVECGVRVGPTTLPGTPGTARGEKKNADVVVAPVLGWYDDAFGGRSRTGYPYTDLERDFDAGCKWPACVGTPGRPRDSHAEGIARFFRDVNDAVWADASIVPGGVLKKDDDEKTNPGEHDAPTVVTFSHFVPLARVYLGTSRMSRVMGSERIGTQALELRATTHVFGHSHVNADDVVDVSDVFFSPTAARGEKKKRWCRFVQNALGYPHERWGNGVGPKTVWPPDSSVNQGGCATS